jgi:hypothetical protein
MPPQTHVDQPRQAQPGSDAEPGTTAPTAPLSRRSVLRGAAGAGAVGFAAAAGAGAVFAATRPSTGTRPAEADAGKVVTTDTAPQKPAGEPLVVYLRDTSTGEFEVFNGTRQVRMRDPKLVAQLLDGVQAAQ